MKQRPLPIAAPPSNVSVFRRPPPAPEVYDWQTDPEYTDLTFHGLPIIVDPSLPEGTIAFGTDDGWLTTELGEPT